MNILLLTQFLSTTKGGGEYLFSIMANSLANRGHKVWIITHRIDNEDYSQFHNNVKILFASSIKYEGGLPLSLRDNVRFIFDAITKGIQLIRNEKIDLIHSNNFSPALSASILSSITGCTHITAMWDIFSLCGNDYWHRWVNQKRISRLYSFLGPKFERWILRMKHDAIHTVSEASKEDLLKFGAKKPIYVIHPTIRHGTNLISKPSTSQFVYVGRLVFYKNLESVIKAISIIKKSHDSIKLKIIGGGPDKDNLQSLTKRLGLEENIEFCGYVSEDEKYKIISSSIAMTFPSLCEGFGLVVLESFSCERPVLVSNVRPLSEIINDKYDGIIINPTDEHEWAKAMIYLMNNPQKALEMGKAGKTKLEQQYTHESMIDNIESMYNKIINLSAS